MIEWNRLFKLLFWASAIGAYAFAVMPGDQMPTLSAWDKMNHMIAFFTIALFMRPAYRGLSTPVIALLLAGLGGFIEICQMIPAVHRDASLSDWIADCLAIVAGLTVANIILFFRDRRWSQVSPES